MKRLMLDASLSPGCVSIDCYTAVLKIQTTICKDGRQVNIKR